MQLPTCSVDRLRIVEWQRGTRGYQPQDKRPGPYFKARRAPAREGIRDKPQTIRAQD
jgi:hypothetical protein